MKAAAVDIGTNTVRLLVADVVNSSGDSRIENAQRYEVITRLGEGLDASGRLGEAAMERALAGLGRYAELIGAAGVEQQAGVATAATRSADNGADFMVRVADVLGFWPRVIDGVEEARLTFSGATNTLAADESYCVVDVGGGSTEFVMGQGRPDYAVSVDIGSVRLTERIRSRALASPAAIRAYVDQLFSGVTPPYPATAVLGSGGTFVTLAAVHLDVDPKLLQMGPRTVLSTAELEATVDRLLRMTVPEIAELPAVAPARAAVLQAGALCAERALAHVGLPEVQISVADILDGVALQLGAETHPAL